MIYAADKPYPQPAVEEKNLDYAHLLLEDFSGPVSELTAITLYIYQSTTQLAVWNEYSNLTHQIAKVEMHHLALLGETIQLLGLNPIYGNYSNQTATYIPWTGAYVNYATDLKQALINDINSEAIAIETYKRHRNIIRDKDIKNLLSRIILDEEIHLSLFQQFYKTLN